MPTSVVLTPPTSEPVSLEMAKQHLRVDTDAEDTYIGLLVTGAREQAEAFCGRPFAAQTLKMTYELGEPYVLPEGAAEPTAVEGFFSDLDQLPTAGNYLEEYRKGISVNRELDWSEAMRQTYTVTVAVNPTVPARVQLAILELVGEWYKNRESSVNGTISVETQVNWERKLAQLRVAPIIY